MYKRQGIAAALTLFLSALLVLRRDFTEELFDHGVLDLLGALLEIFLFLAFLLNGGDVVQITHDLTTSSQTRRRVVLHGQLHDLSLIHI